MKNKKEKKSVDVEEKLQNIAQEDLVVIKYYQKNGYIEIIDEVKEIDYFDQKMVLKNKTIPLDRIVDIVAINY